ncbi:MAG: polysaccharide deacetylase family protein [Gemmatimonadota bacterium]
MGRGPLSRARLLYRGLERSGLLGLWRRLRPSPVVLCYHNVIAADSGRGEAALHLDRQLFEQHLDWLSRNATVVPLLDLLGGGPPPRRPGPPSVAITFDDAYLGVLEIALPLLRRYRFPSTIFVTAQASAQGAGFWWDQVAEARPSLDRASLRDRFGGRGHDILAHLGLDPAAIALPSLFQAASFQSLRSVADSDLTFGAHSMSHPMLAMASDAQLVVELEESRALLQRELGSVMDLLAYPYGNFDRRVATAAAAAGYRAGFTISGGRLTRLNAEFELPRENLSPGDSGPVFVAAASGLRIR